MNRVLMCKLAVCVFAAILFATPSWAVHPDTKTGIESLKKRIEALEKEIGEPEEEFSIEVVGKKITFSGLVELEAGFESTGDEDASDLALATAQFGAEVTFNDSASARIVLLHEEGETEPVEVDEAGIELVCPRKFGTIVPSVEVGKLYVPFGNYNSSFISDPLTLELGETNNTVLLADMNGDLISLSFVVFSGETDEAGDDDTIDTLVAAVELTPAEGLAFGASYMSDLAESDAELVSDEDLYTDGVAGFSLYASIAYGPLGFDAEYLGALDDFEPDVIAAGEDLTGENPAAWNLELSWAPAEQWHLAVRYEEARDYKDDLTRYGGVVSYGLYENTVIALEYLHGDADGGDSDTVTAQLAFEF